MGFPPSLKGIDSLEVFLKRQFVITGATGRNDDQRQGQGGNEQTDWSCFHLGFPFLAARICSQADAGQILAPIVVRELAAGKQFMFADLGETELRGFDDPVRLYEVRWREG